MNAEDEKNNTKTSNKFCKILTACLTRRFAKPQTGSATKFVNFNFKNAA